MRATLLRTLVLISLSVILLGMPLLLTPHRIRPSSFALIKPGMTETEVEEVLGAKAGNYDGYGTRSIVFANIGLDLITTDDDFPPLKTWASRHGAVDVRFDKQKRAYSHSVYDSVPVSWWARLVERVFGRPARPRTVQDSL